MLRTERRISFVRRRHQHSTLNFVEMMIKSFLSVRCLPSRLSLLSRSSTSEATAEFDKAKSRLESSAVEVDNENKLKLYALFKQATNGTCSTPKPGLTDFVGRAKWTAWSALGQLSQADAQKQYIQTVEQLIKSTSNETNVSQGQKNEAKETEGIQLLKKSPMHWHIVLNRPEKYNAITRPMYERLIEILDQAAQDKQVTLVSLTGSGKFYSSGTDLADFAKMAVSACSLDVS